LRDQQATAEPSKHKRNGNPVTKDETKAFLGIDNEKADKTSLNDYFKKNHLGDLNMNSQCIKKGSSSQQCQRRINSLI